MSSLRTPKFLYFDLGNVLLYFDHRRACRNLAALTGADEQHIWDAAFASGLYLQADGGEVDGPAFYERVCQQVWPGRQAWPAYEAFAHAMSDIFEINVPMMAVVGQLESAGYRLGLLSNTCDLHYEFFGRGRYRLVAEAFDPVVLSFKLKLLKPDRRIYEQAAALAGVEPQEVFYVDDVAGHVSGACAAGFDAVQYTSTPALVAELRRRGVRFNY